MADTDAANGPTGDQPQEKTAKQLEKEAIKAAKLAKLKAKLDKKATAPAVPKDKPEKKTKEVKESAVYTASTAPGEKKDITGDMPDAYSPKYVEAAWYAWWEKQGFFKPEYGRKSVLEENPKGKFVMVIPPPNVTGTLHLGHALTNAVEDAITRWHRMNGRTTLWNPGCDHAGIATQVVVEKKLWREEKKTRHDLGREEFIKRVWEWKNEKGERIYEQLRSLGSSFDWSRARFTMDPSMCRAVNEAFVRLHDSGDIYRANRLVNWSCTLKSAISDIEVDKVDVTGRTLFSIPGYENKVEFGVLIHFAYKVIGTDEEIVVATTRIETMLGDTAVAVHPEDTRYKHLVGRLLAHPFCARKIPVIADSYVDQAFGTGAVKITPAHDPNDYEIGKRHQLPFITIFDDEGKIVGDCGQFVGMKRFDCRREIIKALEAKKLYRETKDNPMAIPFCSRSKDVVEPMLKPQWYIKCDKMAAEAIKAVQSGELKIIPDVHVKIWNHWMEGIRDWCISRQLWWGHRIPAYRVNVPKDEETEVVTKTAPARRRSRTGRKKSNRIRNRLPPTVTANRSVAELEECWIAAHNEEEARSKAAKKFNLSPADIVLEQDGDVLDTWFSSGLFPFAIFGWPDNTEDLQAFYPGTLLETGHDILFFWVARMVFFGQRLMGKLPFKEVYLHPMVRDAHGRKMSKSLGNVVDPLDVIRGISLEQLSATLQDSNLDPKELSRALAGQKEDFPNGIPECGTDALRFALCAMTQGRDLNLDILRVQGYRFFCNKLWNAAKFALMDFPQDTTYEAWTGPLPSSVSLADRWLLSRAAQAVATVNTAFQQYDFPTATSACHSLWLYDVCDVYLEYLKPVFQSGTDGEKETARRTLYTVLELGLKLLSPFMPFVTEELYQRLPRKNRECPSICVASYPTESDTPWKDEALEADFATVLKMVHLIRSTRSEYNIVNKQKTTTHLVIAKDLDEEKLRGLFSSLQSLANSELATGAPPAGCSILTVSDKIEIHLVLKGLIDPQKEITKLEKKKDLLTQTITKLNQAMAADDYTTKVPADVQKNNSEKLTQSQGEIEKLEAAIERLKLI
ncbi:valine--tRNA ligase isoform X1 [Plutella xylostella]|uniref:valine--tRNA ligase isoform X1 n=1 Tax=Plutella xylostella TaxID=51655 RepID=UPI0020324349|nr:valine--tRNA ligase isoform X1 [Plutella xylostella]